MSSAVPLGSPHKKFKSLKQRIEHYKWKAYPYLLSFYLDYDIKGKLITIFRYSIDVIVTGLLLWYVVYGNIDIIRFGLGSALFLYYLDKSTYIIGRNIFRKKNGN